MDEVVVVESSSKSTTTARLPRWTRQEILVLIQGKRVAENRGRTSSGRAHESKWAAVSSYCRRHGANRGPVQCRKRWSNLSGDFKKIKEWEANNNNKGSETESYWAMRNDLRREKKLPGFFDREVYDILAGGGGGCDADVAAAEEEEEHDGSAHPPGGSPEKAKPEPVTEQHGKAVQSHDQECSGGQGSDHDLNQPGAVQAEEGRKRKRCASEDVDGEEAAVSLQHNRLIEALENNGKLFSAYIETHNTHLRLDREQRKEQSNSIVTALNKIVETLGRIADKLQ